MRFGNPDIMQAFVDLVDPFDYQGFLDLCSERNLVTDLSEREYAQYAGMVLLAARKYQDRSMYEAYMRFVTEDTPIQRPVLAPSVTQPVTVESNPVTVKCGSCGGGKVR
jgi:hypothetical protein